MTIKKRNPWTSAEVPVRRAYPFDSLTRDLGRLFNLPLGMPLNLPSSMLVGANQDWPESWGTMEAGFSPRMDMSETDTSIIVSVELPGMSTDDIEVTLSAGTLTITGEKSRETGTTETEVTEIGDYRTERFFGSFRRTIALPVEVNTEGLSASFENGVLVVTMAKAVAKEETFKIDVKAA